MARMKLAEASRPSPLCWGFRTSLGETDAHGANGSMPLHLLADIKNYTLQTRSARCRNKLRNLRKQVSIVELHMPDLLLERATTYFPRATPKQLRAAGASLDHAKYIVTEYINHGRTR